MKKLIMLINTLIISSIAFSQTDTGIKVKCFPIPVVKSIAKDLLGGDSAKIQLRLTEKQLLETEKKVQLKDSIINNMKLKEVNYQTIIESQNQKYNLMEKYSKRLERDLKKEKVKNEFRSTLTTTALLAITVLLIVK